MTAIVFGSASFDAATIHFATLEFGPAGAPPLGRKQMRDVNGDGYSDLNLKFSYAATGTSASDTTACVSGIAGTTPFVSCDTLTVRMR